jgi:hypothetical protein
MLGLGVALDLAISISFRWSGGFERAYRSRLLGPSVTCQLIVDVIGQRLHEPYKQARADELILAHEPIAPAA